MQQRHGVVRNSFITGFGNNTVSLLAALMVFGTVFATLGAEMTRPEVLEVMQTSGPAATGLTFIWMPQLFARMQFGGPLSILFFLGLSFAAFSSLIAMIELASRMLVDLGLSRRTAVTFVGVIGFCLGIPSAVNLTFFENQDFVWGVALMISGAFIAFSIIRYGASAFRREAVDAVEGDWRAGPGWALLMKFLIPIQAVILLVWWLWQAARVYAPDSWYNPFDPYSVMTCLVQWALVMLAFVLMNRSLNRRMFPEVVSHGAG
jgi:NSS family neurotransmitter:Na+ symporter